VGGQKSNIFAGIGGTEIRFCCEKKKGLADGLLLHLLRHARLALLLNPVDKLKTNSVMNLPSIFLAIFFRHHFPTFESRYARILKTSYILDFQTPSPLRANACAHFAVRGRCGCIVKLFNTELWYYRPLQLHLSASISDLVAPPPLRKLHQHHEIYIYVSNTAAERHSTGHLMHLQRRKLWGWSAAAAQPCGSAAYLIASPPSPRLIGRQLQRCSRASPLRPSLASFPSATSP
jgi:hypothetical protein